MAVAVAVSVVWEGGVEPNWCGTTCTDEDEMAMLGGGICVPVAVKLVLWHTACTGLISCVRQTVAPSGVA
jgi:hypothetical protein